MTLTQMRVGLGNRPFSPGALLLAVTLTSCGTKNGLSIRAPDRDGSYFQTDRLIYTLTTRDPESRVIVRYKNPYAFPVYFRVCGHKNIHEALVAAGTKPISDVVSATTGAASDLGLQWACLDAPRRIVAPSGILVDSVFIHRAAALGAMSGTYRVVYRVYDRPSRSELDEVGLLPVDERRSNIFAINIAPTEK